jgi:NADH-quinone oxidoreductase subunit L
MRGLVQPAAVEQLLYLIPLIPILGAAVCGLFGARLSRANVHLVAVGAVAASFLISVGAFLSVWDLRADLVQQVYTWVAVGELSLEIRFVVDALSSIMLLVITGVGLLIHVYSTGYMAHDKAYWRYFAYLNLFVGSMLILVLADSLPVLFIGWEGVGLCSYLLIGFWYSDTEKAIAGKKAFIVNRIGDFGFLLGMLVLFGLFGTFSVAGMREAAAGISGDGLVPIGVAFGGWTWAAALGLAFLLIFIGCTGKSAQIPLFVWLPDAMAGPTPVSALIHAATMVTAGVYVLARLSFLFVITPQMMAVVAFIGALTALLAGFMALFQNGLKKVLAYSTVSQLGFMFLGVGVGAFHAGVYHLFTHAFFKACLFLCAGSVMHAMGDTEDVRRMGGLRTKLPHTHATFLIATLAITGLPVASGFFSKDIILHAALVRDLGMWAWLPWVLWIMGTVAALFTAIYMWRLYFLTFHGEPREKALFDHAHESPPSMTVPLWILAIASVGASFWGLAYLLRWPQSFAAWLGPVVAGDVIVAGPDVIPSWVLLVFAIAVAAAGLAIAWTVWGKAGLQGDAAAARRLGPIYTASYAKLWWDEFYDRVFVRPLVAISNALWWVVDVLIIDRGLVEGAARAVKRTSRFLSPFQNGDAQRYAVVVAIGTAVIMGLLMGARAFMTDDDAVVAADAPAATATLGTTPGPAGMAPDPIGTAPDPAARRLAGEVRGTEPRPGLIRHAGETGGAR